MALGTKYTRSIEIELGGKSTKLRTALSEANRAIRSTKSEMGVLQKSLNLEWDSSKFQRAQELARKQVEQTQRKVEALEKALAALDAQGEDRSGERYQSIRRELSYVQVEAQRAQQQLESLNALPMDRLKAQIAQVGEQLSGAGKALTLGVTAPLAAAGAAAVNYASDAQEAANKVEVAFGDSAGAVQAWADTTLESYGLAKGSALDMAALFGDMATSMGVPREEAAALSMELVGLAADLASFKNVSVDQAKTALNSIFTGETESLKQLGVVMTQANLEAYALAQGYTTAYTAMDQAQQVAVRYQYVLSATRNAQGDFARTSDSTANQLRILQESLKELAATAGDELLPMVTPILAALNELIQSFGDLDEEQRQAVVQAALFAAALGPMLQLTGGVAAAIEGGITVYQTLKTALTAATAAQTGMNAAMAASPVGALATAVGALVAVLGAWAVSSALAGSGAQGLTEDIHAAREEYAALSEEIAQNNQDTLSMAAALEELAATEEKTAAQKAAILELVDSLNQAVPGLTLAYDQQTDSLNMTTEAIRQLAQAEYDRAQQEAAVARLKEAYQEQIRLSQELEEAQRNLEEAEAEYNKTSGYAQQANVVARGNLLKARAAVDELTGAMAENEAEIQALEDQYGSFAAAADTAAQAVGEAGDAAAAAGEEFSHLSDVVETTRGACSLLQTAQKEMAESGYLTLDTVLSLIEQYPSLTGYLLTTADGYALADGALQAYLDTQRAEYALALEEAQRAADAIVSAETDKINALNMTTASAREQLIALAELYQSMGANADNRAEGDSYYRLANQYRAAAEEIKSAQEVLATYDRVSASYIREGAASVSGGRTSSSSSSSSQRAKTQAELDLEAYQEAVEELDHLRAMDEISEEEYYRRKAALGERYLAENRKQRQALEEELYQYAQKEGERREAAYQEELADLQYYLDMDIITQQDYYREMEQLRDKYLEEDSEAWRQATVELYEYQKEQREKELEELEAYYQERKDLLSQALEAQNSRIEAAWQQQKEAAQAAYEARKAQIQAELELEEGRLNAILEGIDAEVQARKELREDQEEEDAIAQARKRLEAAQAQLAFARTEEDAAQWEKEVARLQAALDQAIQDREDTLFYRQKEEEKGLVQDQLEAAREEADQALESAQADYDATLDRLEAEYQAALAQAQAEYDRALRELEAQQKRQEQLAQLAAAGITLSATGADTAGHEEEIRGIAQANGVDLGVAEAMWRANQRNEGADGAEYYAGAALAQEAAAAAAVQAAAASTAAAQSVTRSATVNYTAGGIMTEGQIARTVKKILDDMDRA